MTNKIPVGIDEKGLILTKSPVEKLHMETARLRKEREEGSFGVINRMIYYISDICGGNDRPLAG